MDMIPVPGCGMDTGDRLPLSCAMPVRAPYHSLIAARKQARYPGTGQGKVSVFISNDYAFPGYA